MFGWTAYIVGRPPETRAGSSLWKCWNLWRSQFDFRSFQYGGGPLLMPTVWSRG